MPSGTIVECSRVYVGSWDPWDPGTVVLEIPKGFLRGQQEDSGDRSGFPATLFFDHFFDIVLGPQFSRFWCQLGSNLPPNLAAKSTQIRPKRDPNPLPSCIIFSIPSLIDFGRLLDRIWVGFGCQVDRPRHQKSIKSVELSANLVFLAISDILPTRNHMINFLMDLGTNLAGFGEGFGGQVGPKLVPNGTKTRPHNQSKK